MAATNHRGPTPEGDRLIPTIGPLTVALLILSPAAFPSLSLWANNIAQVPKSYRLALVVLGFLLVGIALFWLINRFVQDARVAAFLTFMTLLVLSSGGALFSEQSWVWRWAGAFTLLIAANALLVRLRSLWLLDVILVGCASVLLFAPLITGVGRSLTASETMVAPEPGGALPIMAETPDIILVVVDGYTSLPVLKELFGYHDEDLRDDLAAQDFTIREPALSAYPTTHLALSSLFELDYGVEETLTAPPDEGIDLAAVIGGDNYLVRLLSKNGYRITMVESGWHMSICGVLIDVCITSPFIDEGVGAVLRQSLLWPFIGPSVGSAFTHGARHSMAWTEQNVGEIAGNASPDFVFVHVLAPHPPLLLDAQCDIVQDRRLEGVYMDVVGVGAETAQVRLDGYVNQVRCVNEFVRRVARTLTGNDALVLVMGDHGSDTMSQLSIPPQQWSEPQIVERSSVFLAVKPTPGCEETPGVVTVALFRSLLSCAGGMDLEPIEERMFLVSQFEEGGRRAPVHPLTIEEVAHLGACLEELGVGLSC